VPDDIYWDTRPQNLRGQRFVQAPHKDICNSKEGYAYLKEFTDTPEPVALMIFCKERLPQWFNKDYGIPLSQLREKDLAVGSVSLQEIATSNIAFTLVHILGRADSVLRPL
jgi:hypothetical protein